MERFFVWAVTIGVALVFVACCAFVVDGILAERGERVQATVIAVEYTPATIGTDAEVFLALADGREVVVDVGEEPGFRQNSVVAAYPLLGRFSKAVWRWKIVGVK